MSVSPQTKAIGAGQNASFTVTTTDTTGVTWSATAGTVDANGNFTAPSGQSTTVTVTVTSKKDPTKSASAIVNVVAPGTVATTANVQVALYSIAPASSGNVSVQFGLDTTYGLTTWTQPVPQGGGAVPIFVAGMKANTLYHMRGVVQFADGSQFMDADQTFTTQGIPAASLPVITTTTTAGMTPQSGVEMLQDVLGNMTFVPVLFTDLSGNVLWGYNPGPLGIVNPVKLLPNGHFLMNFSGVGGNTDGSGSTMQEVDLTGKVVWQMAAAQLNSALAAATCAGCNISVVGTHHDFVMLPNGHLIVIAATQETISGTVVTGDVVIDLTQNFNSSNPATVNWLWNEFDWLDVNRQPMSFPDWTHTNAVIYSSDDQNLIVSIRHQNWLVKFNYAGGTGDGHILWKMGYQGDFTLVGGTDPTDWFYAQHGPSFVTTNTTGKFSLILFDNGNDRVFPSGVTCGTTGEPPCQYSTVPLLQIDETVSPMTATLAFNPTAPTFSVFGGNAAVMNNGNVEFCESANGPGFTGAVYEWTQGSSPQIVWQLLESGQYTYRGQRLPSMYPGVQW